MNFKDFFSLVFLFKFLRTFKYGVATCLQRDFPEYQDEMAATSSSELTFVDEDDLPVAFLRIARADSEDEAPSDVMADNSTCLDFF